MHSLGLEPLTLALQVNVVLCLIAFKTTNVDGNMILSSGDGRGMKVNVEVCVPAADCVR